MNHDRETVEIITDNVDISVAALTADIPILKKHNKIKGAAIQQI